MAAGPYHVAARLASLMPAADRSRAKAVDPANKSDGKGSTQGSAMMLPLLLALIALLGYGTSLVFPDYPDDSDLFKFVSRPDLRPPRFNVSIYKPDQVTPGYWFTAPYSDLHSRLPTSQYSPGQMGPHIYDGNGDLVWSGAHLFHERATFDFKAVHHNGSQYLTFIAGEDMHGSDSPGGSGIILDSSYRYLKTVEQRAGRGTMNMHEFNTIDDGRRALTIIFASTFTDVLIAGDKSVKMFVGNNGFAEVDTATGETIFEWWALDHLNAAESQVFRPSSPGSYASPWDFFHMNSVDKNAEGDYLISARYTNCIYKISGKDGSIIWRLGGPKSDFKLVGFNMSSQHDARWQSENKTTTVLTFFNNHSDGDHSTAKTSAVMEIALDVTTMTATLRKEWERPDGKLTKLRGSAQRLENGHILAGWSENTYFSEFDADGALLMEAQMASHRFNTYRTYKFNFTATPSEPIAIKAYVYGVKPESSTTVYYVSWNGATEVAGWKFYSSDEGEVVFAGSTPRTGFETMYMTTGLSTKVMAEAIDKDGNSLGKSNVAAAQLPASWRRKNGRPNVGEDVLHYPAISPLKDLETNGVEDPASPGSDSTLRDGLMRNIPLFGGCMVAGLLLSLVVYSAVRRLLHRGGGGLARGRYELLRDEP